MVNKNQTGESWRSRILREFAPNAAPLTLVADPDGLLLEEYVLEGIRDRGFELIPFEDHIAFRYAYESKFRSRWDRGEQTDLVVVLRSEAGDLNTLPYDLLQAGRRLSFNLGEIFPNLSYPVVAALDRADLDALYEAQLRHAPGVLGDNATKEFVLRHVFEIAPELIRTPSDILRVLLRRHYRRQRIPEVLDERLIQILRQNDIFESWPLDFIIPDREAFFLFLQERWPVFLDRTAKQPVSDAHEDKQPYPLAYSGPADLPFDHDDIRIYIDNLFLEGLLHPVAHKNSELLSKSWIGIGIQVDERSDRLRRLKGLLDTINATLPEEHARHTDWFHFAGTWAELKAMRYDDGVRNNDIPELNTTVDSLAEAVDKRFLLWIQKRFSGLYNLPPVPPVMVHHIPRFISRTLNTAPGKKAAFVLVDGIALDQWIVLRKELVKQRPDFVFRENAVFAWLPTITSVSRQAAFAGKPPVYFPNSINSTDKESSLWSQFWNDQAMGQKKAAYLKGLGDGSLDSVEEIISRPELCVLGLVVDKVDKIMHGMELGSAGMHNQVRQWAGQPFTAQLFDLLLDNGFSIYLSSDHGNIEANGCGRPAEGSIADQRGERVRIYSDAQLRTRIKDQFPDALEWSPAGLPEKYFPLFAPSRTAFIQEAKNTICHGGISLEELIVPFVQIERKDS